VEKKLKVTRKKIKVESIKDLKKKETIGQENQELNVR
jgi:hypothetical protein